MKKVIKEKKVMKTTKYFCDICRGEVDTTDYDVNMSITEYGRWSDYHKEYSVDVCYFCFKKYVVPLLRTIGLKFVDEYEKELESDG